MTHEYNTDKIDFNNLPIIIDGLRKEIIELKEYIYKTLTPPKKRPVNVSIDGLLDYLEEKSGKKFAKQTVYGYVNFNKIPYFKHGKELGFCLNHIDQWLENGKSMNGLKFED